MSYFLFTEEGKPMKFLEYYEYIEEAVRPTKTKFGTNKDMNNGKWQQKMSFHSTFIKHDDNAYVAVFVDGDGTIGFGTSNTYSLDIAKYDQDMKSWKSGFSVFGKVFYVMLEMIKKKKPSEINFSGANPSLERLYAKIVKNPATIRELERIGYHYKGMYGGEHYFELEE